MESLSDSLECDTELVDDIFPFFSVGNGYIEGKELDDFLVQLVTSINKEDVGSEVGTIYSVVVIM